MERVDNPPCRPTMKDHVVTKAGHDAWVALSLVHTLVPVA
jgi:hypothetical protein